VYDPWLWWWMIFHEFPELIPAETFLLASSIYPFEEDLDTAVGKFTNSSKVVGDPVVGYMPSYFPTKSQHFPLKRYHLDY
jgi:hypothetical protein